MIRGRAIFKTQNAAWSFRTRCNALGYHCAQEDAYNRKGEPNGFVIHWWRPHHG